LIQNVHSHHARTQFPAEVSLVEKIFLAVRNTETYTHRQAVDSTVDLISIVLLSYVYVYYYYYYYGTLRVGAVMPVTS
jgi:hypothetical protein